MEKDCLRVCVHIGAAGSVRRADPRYTYTCGRRKNKKELAEDFLLSFSTPPPLCKRVHTRTHAHRPEPEPLSIFLSYRHCNVIFFLGFKTKLILFILFIFL
jgi:hypothetical protein